MPTANEIRESSEWWRNLSGEEKAAYLIELGRPRTLIERVADAITVARYAVKKAWRRDR